MGRLLQPAPEVMCVLLRLSNELACSIADRLCQLVAHLPSAHTRRDPAIHQPSGHAEAVELRGTFMMSSASSTKASFVAVATSAPHAYMGHIGDVGHVRDVSDAYVGSWRVYARTTVCVSSSHCLAFPLSHAASPCGGLSRPRRIREPVADPFTEADFRGRPLANS